MGLLGLLARELGMTEDALARKLTGQGRRKAILTDFNRSNRRMPSEWVIRGPGGKFKSTPQKQPITTDQKPIKIEMASKQVVEVIDYLNKICNKAFRPATYEKLISAALRNYSVDDLKKVVDNKSRDGYFMENPQFLRPKTLFGSMMKIDQYLNAGAPLNKAQVRFRQNMDVARRVLERMDDGPEEAAH